VGHQTSAQWDIKQGEQGEQVFSHHRGAKCFLLFPLFPLFALKNGYLFEIKNRGLFAE
jgi:hypothetical protein